MCFDNRHLFYSFHARIFDPRKKIAHGLGIDMFLSFSAQNHQVTSIELLITGHLIRTYTALTYCYTLFLRRM